MSLPYKHGVPGSDRISNASSVGVGVGSVVGAVRGTWEWSNPKGETAMAGLAKSLTTMGSTVLMFGGIALVYSATEVGMEYVRGTADWRNGALAGLAAGAVVGAQKGSIGSAASAGALFCLGSVVIDASSGRMRSNIFSEDGMPNNPHATITGTRAM